MNEHANEQSDDYLWDGTGTPDPEVARLEKTLGVLRHRGITPRWPARPSARPRVLRAVRPFLAAAAVLVLVAAGAWFALVARSSSWSVVRVSGMPSVDGRVLDERGSLGRGEWLETDGASRARVAVGRIGSVDVGPNTRVQLVASGGREHRLALDRGTIHARIWAPPKFFFVETSAAVAVDLGCAYTLNVDDQGTGMLRVTHGWVGFERGSRQTYVPEGAVCVTRADKGPGTPRYEDAPSGYAQALMLLDFGDPSDVRRDAALEHVLSSARRRDALTLWHLLTRGTGAERRRVYARLASLVPPPGAVTLDRVLQEDRAALDEWWDAIGVNVSTWWRFFKKKW